MSIPAPILVTGAHRTGTTWVGKMLAASSQVAYISEPLNVWHRPGVLRAPVSKWYTLICQENEDEFLPAFRDLLNFRYGLVREIRSLRSRKDFLRMGRDFSIFLSGRLLRQRPLIKDPFAVFSAAWFATRLGCRVVITVRHPAGFASSLKRLNWSFDFRDLLEQPLLMERWLGVDRAEMEAAQTDDILGQAALLWRMIYRVVARMMKLHPSIIVVRHEDLSHDPVSCYRDLYAALDLDFTPAVERTILNASSSENPTELLRSNVHAVKLDSRANLDNWKKRLSPDEILRIRKITGKTAKLFYSDEEW
ncbi:MAG: sulfotransferase [Anaerolineales bacterium]